MPFRTDDARVGWTSLRSTPVAGCNVYLKQVELENFKSFGGKLTVPLMEGYTAVTGPNGSGKSNITDAILFVLGPKSSKAVRAGKLTDLIFDGGKSRNKAGYTKVSLVFDNTDRLMPWDDDEVRLTRYVKMSDNGVDYSSYFFVNDRKSTMSEFDSLLTRARISADGYNMVQQGDVTRIVQMGAVERRRILDGISGIASFDADIDKAKSERSEADTNMDRISIIVNELSSELVRLGKDREDARRYLDAKERMDHANAQLSVRRLQLEKAKLDNLERHIEQDEADLVRLEQERSDFRIRLGETDEAIVAKEAEIASKVGPEYTELKGRIEQAKVDLATKRDRKETAESDLEQQESFKAAYDEALEENRAEIARLTEERDTLSGRLADAERARADAEAEEAEISDEMASTGGEHRELQERLNVIDADFDQCSALLRESQGRLAKAESASEEAHTSYALLDEKAQALDFEIKDAKWNLDQVKAEAGPSTEDFGNRILEAKRRESELERQEQELLAAQKKADSEYNALQAEKRVSERVNRGSVAVEAILALRNKGGMKGIHGTIQELATVDKSMETALSVAAGGKMQAVVVDDDQVAADAIAYLKKEKLGRVTFLPLTKMMGGKPRAKAIMSLKESIGYAIDLIEFDQKYYNAFWYVLGDTLVVKDMDTARRIMGGIRIVTTHGELIEASGAMVGGNISQQNLLKFGAASEDRLAEAGERLRQATATLDVLRVKLKAVRDEIRGIDDEMRSISSSGMKQRELLAQQKGRLAELEKSMRTVAEDLRTARSRVAEADAHLETERATFASVSERLTAITSERTVVKDRMAEIAPVELQERMQAVRDRLHAIRGRISELIIGIGRADAEIQGLGRQNESLEMQLKSVIEAIDADNVAIAENTALMDRARIDLDALRSIEREMESGIQDLRTQRDALRETRFQLQASIDERTKSIETTGSICEGHRAQVIMARQSVAECQQEVDLLTITVEEPVPSEEEIRRRIRALEKELSALGNVNLRAIEDYEVKKARHDSLSAEVDALTRRIRELNELMDSLSSKKKGLFMKSYDAVNENFKAIYAQLSGGGEAFMGLDNPDDPFAGGLMINAKPRNGKLLKLESLSGGEKSLTALSFIFAIQEHQPSPFYVLDEVDMFLDSVNAEMVAKRVRESSAKAQFIQVSLRKVTLALADHLIGVTRPPSGVSKVVMQPDLAEVSRYEEEAERKRMEAGS